MIQIFWIAIFITSIIVLLKSADYFTEYAGKLGVLLKLSPFVTGVLIVSVGTGIPELASGIIVALRGGTVTAFVTENVIGSNIANIFLVVGIGAVLGGAVFVKRNIIHIDLPFLALSTTLFIIFVMWDGRIIWYESLILLAGFGIYILYLFTHPEKINNLSLKKKREKWTWRLLIVLVLSGAGIYFGARYTVDSILAIAELFNISSSVLVMSVVALGTSLPELFVTISAVRRRNYDVALGNVFGSNIFNALLIIGIAGLISPLSVSDITLKVGLPFLGISTILYIISALDREVKNYEGAMFLLLYIAFIISLIAKN